MSLSSLVMADYCNKCLQSQDFTQSLKSKFLFEWGIKIYIFGQIYIIGRFEN